ncbi:unnamed protein product [Schistosoma curassoni]|uniref:Uncharacterized protein n=1 Tax=Schistosoma curassoni TaxID=6186 RepID=A0A183JLR1_9TREM|nr:unnamed protein product [Schistosoma curassoni]
METEGLENELIQSIRPSLNELLRIWDYVGEICCCLCNFLEFIFALFFLSNVI